MDFKYHDLNIHYVAEGKGPPVVFLHGWGANLKTFDRIVPNLINHYTVYRIDLPGFGKSDALTNSFSLDDYTAFLDSFVGILKLDSPVLIGHSFGGKIILSYLLKNPNIKKAVLISSSGIRRPLSLKKRLQVAWFKAKKRWYILRKDGVGLQQLYDKSGSDDYKNASLVMKATLSKVVAKGLQKDLKKINQEVLLIWGKLDKTTPYRDALLMNRKIKNSGLVTFEEAGHFPYLEDPVRFISVLKNYLGITD